MDSTSWRTRRLAAALAGVGLLAVGCSYTSREALPPAPVSMQSTTVHAADGTLITTLHAEENRRDVLLEEVPTTLRDAVVAIEDERFYRHNGIDLRALTRAVRANAEAGGEVSEGGSTITQQYVKQVLLHDSRQTVERKLQEASLALQLERHYSKDRILELYLNAVYFGNGAYGVAAAAQQYFGIPVDQLGLPQAALLAALIRRPTADDPYDEPVRARARRDLVLDRMERNHFATAAEVEAAKAAPLGLRESTTTPAAERYEAAHLVEEVKQWILRDPRFGASKQERRDLLFGGGLRITTTVDLAAQAAAEAAADEVLPDDADPDVALVSVVPETGEVRAMVGGRDFFGDGAAAKLNLATQVRQTGSSFKPLVLAAALQDGIPATRTYAAPGCLDVPGTSPPYRPCNYSDSQAAAQSDLVEGTVHSYNTLYVQLMQDVGPERAMEVARDLGIDEALEPVLSAVLGSNDVTPVDMAHAYATLANRGVEVAPVLVTRITRPDGTVLYSHRRHEREAVDREVADTVTAILQQVIERGTARAADIGRPAAGKTGTADDHHDAWFVGYTPQLATAVWVGFHEGQIPMEPPTTPIRVTGGSYPARIWQRFMAAALEGEPVEQLPAPPPGALSPTTTVVPPTEGPLTPVDAPHEPQGAGVGVDPVRPARTTTTLSGPDAGLPAGFRRVPSVVGRELADARAELIAAGFRVTARAVPAKASRSGTVVGQTPSGGTAVREGSTVDLAVAR